MGFHNYHFPKGFYSGIGMSYSRDNLEETFLEDETNCFAFNYEAGYLISPAKLMGLELKLTGGVSKDNWYITPQLALVIGNIQLK